MVKAVSLFRRAALGALLLGPSAPAAAEYGSTAAPYLKIDPSARSAAIGGAFAGVANDAGALFHNPAGLALLPYQELMFSHMELLQGMHCESLAYALPLEDSRLSLGFYGELMTSGSMVRYNSTGDSEGNFSAAEAALGAAAAYRLGGGFAAGAALKALYQGLASERAYTAAFDAGGIYSRGKWRFGLSLQNAGAPLKLHDEAFSLPLSVKAGVMYRGWRYASLSAQATKYLREDAYLSLGAEAPLTLTSRNTVFLRAGYRTGSSSGAGTGLSLGVGVRDKRLEFNYGLTPMGDLGVVHRVSIGYKFGERIDVRQ